MGKRKNKAEDNRLIEKINAQPAGLTRKKSKTREYIESFIIAALIAFFVRSFFIQAFKIPSSSMEPTLLIGDHLLVNRLSYVVKVPFTDMVLFNLGTPERGEIIVFRYPADTSKDFIKRVIAKPGDTVEIRDKKVFVNGEKSDDPWGFFSDDMNLPAYVSPKDNLGPIKVPKDAYFVMGDNRDRSLDSRFWGFVKHDLLVGRALIIYFSWNNRSDGVFDYIRWTRIGKLIR